MKKTNIFISLMLISFSSFGDQYSLNTTIRTVGTMEGKFGQCYAKLANSFSSKTAFCSEWVSFGCDGVYNDEKVAFQMFDQALMAKALDRKVKLWVEDGEKSDDYCTVKRILVQ